MSTEKTIDKCYCVKLRCIVGYSDCPQEVAIYMSVEFWEKYSLQ